MKAKTSSLCIYILTSSVERWWNIKVTMNWTHNGMNALKKMILLQETMYSRSQQSRYFWNRYDVAWPFQSKTNSGQTIPTSAVCSVRELRYQVIWIHLYVCTYIHKYVPLVLNSTDPDLTDYENNRPKIRRISHPCPLSTHLPLPLPPPLRPTRHSQQSTLMFQIKYKQ
jgi:hypothetical protein